METRVNHTIRIYFSAALQEEGQFKRKCHKSGITISLLYFTPSSCQKLAATFLTIDLNP